MDTTPSNEIGATIEPKLGDVKMEETREKDDREIKESYYTVMNDILSRCDTIHDFQDKIGVYGYLDKNPEFAISSTKLESGFKKYRFEVGHVNDVIVGDMKRLMKKAAIGFSFQHAYTDGVVFPHSSSHFEANVVEFFEHYFPNDLDKIALMSPTAYKEKYLINFKIDRISPHNSMDKLHGKIAMFLLGTTGKVAKDGKEPRSATGIFTNEDVKDEFQEAISGFFKSPKKDGEVEYKYEKVCFVVDASTVSNDIFDNEKHSMFLGAPVSSDWDSATKYTGARTLPGELKISGDKKDMQQIIYSIKDLEIKKTSDSNEDYKTVYKIVDPNGETFQGESSEIDRTVDGIARCLSKPKECTLQPAPNKKQMERSQKGLFYFDIKRSGDGCQVVNLKELNEESVNNDLKTKFVLVTNDHLAFLKARVNKVPVVFTKKHNDTKILFCVNDVPYNYSIKTHLTDLQMALEDEYNSMVAVIGNRNEIEKNLKESIVIFETLNKDLIAKMKQNFETWFDIWFPNSSDEMDEDIFEMKEQDRAIVRTKLFSVLYDFFLTYVDMISRLNTIAGMFNFFETLNKKILDNKIEDINAVDEDTLLYKLEEAKSLIYQTGKYKILGFGSELYKPFMDSTNVTYLRNYCDTVMKIPDLDLIVFAMERHFDLVGIENSEVLTNMLNFVPVLENKRYFAFLKKNYKNAGGKIKKTRDTLVANANANKQSMHAYNIESFFISKRNKNLKAVDPQVQHQMKTIAEEEIDQIQEYDDMLKSISFKGYTKNFNYRYSKLTPYKFHVSVEQKGGAFPLGTRPPPLVARRSLVPSNKMIIDENYQTPRVDHLSFVNENYQSNTMPRKSKAAKTPQISRLFRGIENQQGMDIGNSDIKNSKRSSKLEERDTNKSKWMTELKERGIDIDYIRKQNEEDIRKRGDVEELQQYLFKNDFEIVDDFLEEQMYACMMVEAKRTIMFSEECDNYMETIHGQDCNDIDSDDFDACLMKREESLTGSVIRNIFSLENFEEMREGLEENVLGDNIASLNAQLYMDIKTIVELTDPCTKNKAATLKPYQTGGNILRNVEIDLTEKYTLMGVLIVMLLIIDSIFVCYLQKNMKQLYTFSDYLVPCTKMAVINLVVLIAITLVYVFV